MLHFLWENLLMVWHLLVKDTVVVLVTDDWKV